MVGAKEVCDLPDLGIYDIHTRIDTGAKTSSIHVDQLKKLTRNGKPWIAFDIHPDIYNVDDVIHCESPIKDIRKIKSSNGESQERYIIETTLGLADQTWPVEISLADRSEMSHLMLLGRQGMSDRLLVDPSQNYLTNNA